MTHEILSMPAGVDADYIIAREVMGWVITDECTLVPPEHQDWLEARLHPYSTDISAAWEVVEKIQIHTIRRVANDEPDKAALWQAFVYADSALSGIADTAPLAICKASLLAVMKE